jgi:hypothetical protein
MKEIMVHAGHMQSQIRLVHIWNNWRKGCENYDLVYNASLAVRPLSIQTKIMVGIDAIAMPTCWQVDIDAIEEFTLHSRFDGK